MRASSTKALLVGLVLVAPLLARSEPDTFFLGREDTANKTFSSSGEAGNAYAALTAVAADRRSLTVQFATGDQANFHINDLVMVIQTVQPGLTNGSSPIDLSGKQAGMWEFAVLDQVPGPGSLHLRAPLVNTYASSGAQVIRVPEWHDVTVGDGVTLSPRAWDGKTGGVLAFLATGTVTLGVGAKIDATGKGFRGGQFVYKLNGGGNATQADTNTNSCNKAGDAFATWGALKGEGLIPERFGLIDISNGFSVISGGTNPIGSAFAANAGGSGSCLRAGGGGGGNGAQGGAGGKNTDDSAVGGAGGAKLQYSTTKQLTLGGGGGSGHVTDTGATSQGGAGGGLIYIRAGAMAVSVTGTHVVSANGAPGSSGVAAAGGAGGGAGGTVSVRVAGLVPCGVTMEAKGGAGGGNAGNFAGGGGGGGGYVYVQANAYSCAVSAAGGAAGTSSDATFSGLSGASGSAGADPRPFAEPPQATVTFPAMSAQLNNTTAQQPITGNVPDVTGAPIVTIYLDGVPQTPAATLTGNTFTLTVPGGIPEGDGSYEIWAVTSQDGLSREGPRHTFNVDRTAPPLSGFSASAGGSSLTSGKKTRFATVHFQFTSSDSTASFQCRLGTSGAATLCTSPHDVTVATEGTYHFEVYAQDPFGNPSAPVQSFDWTLDQTAPASPVISKPDSLSPVGARPEIKGTVAEDNAVVSVFIDDGTNPNPATMTVRNWSFTPTSDVSPDGVHWVRVVATDEAGNSSVPSVRVFSVDSTAPAKPTILAPADTARISSLQPVVKVSAEPNSTLTVTLNPGALATTKTFDSVTGTWNIQPTANLTNGTGYTLTVTATDSVGNVSPAASVGFTVDMTGPNAPVVTQPTSSPPLASGTVQVKGSAEDGSTVLLFLGASQIGTVALPAGTTAFTFDIPVSLADGPYTLTVKARDAAGNVGADTTVNFTVDTKAPPPPAITKPLDGSAVSSKTPLFQGTAEKGSTVSLTVTATETTTGGPYTGTATADPVTGIWTTSALSPSTPLTENGTYRVTVTARDAAGNQGQASTADFKVDTLGPGAPVVLEPAADAFVNTQTPLVRGTAEAGSTVTVTFAGNQTVTARANSTGDWAMTAPSLSPVAQTLMAKATDAAGNDSGSVERPFTVDVSSPGVPVVSSPLDGALLNTSTPAITGTAEAAATVIFTKGGAQVGAVVVPVSGNWTFTAPLSFGEGPQTLKLKVRDRAGNESGEVTLGFTVDTRPPPQPVLTAPSGYVTVATPTIRGTAEPSSTVVVSLRLQSAPATVVKTGQVTADAAGDWSVTALLPAGDLEQKTYTAEAFARDGANNQSLTSSLLTFTVDSVKPATPEITFPAQGSIIGTDTPTLTGTADPDVDVVLTLTGPDTSGTADDRQWTLRASRTGNWKIDVAETEKLVPGQYIAHVKAVDEATNESPLSADWPFTVDIAVPDTFFTLTPGALTNDPSKPFEYSSTKSDVTFECSLDGAEFIAPCKTTYSVEDGSHTLLARARDNATGLVDSSPVRHTWRLDTKAPTTTYGLTPPPVTNELTARLTFAANESNVTFVCKLDGVEVSGCDGDVTVTITQTEPVVLHTFTVQTTDEASNTAAPVPFSWTVNQSLPDTQVQSHPDNPSNSSSARFEFVAVPNTSEMTFDCNLDGAGFTPCVSGVTFAGLGHGSHTLAVRAKDGLNNADPQPAAYSWMVDLVEPETTLDAKPAALSRETQAHFEFSSEMGATFECRLVEEGASSTPAFTLCVSPLDEVRTDGVYTMFIRAKDPAGNLDTTPVSVMWTVDTLEPAVPEVAADVRDHVFRTTTPELKGSAENGSTVFISIDDGAAVAVVVSGGSWSFTPATALSEGGHRLSVHAVDAAGNPSASSDSVTFGVDTQPPTTQIVTGPDGRIRTSSVTFEFASNEADATFLCSFDGADFEPCSGFSRDDLSEGTYTLKVRAVDRAGNEGPVVSRSWKVYLGGDIRTKGGGLSCASSGSGDASLALLGLGGLALLATRRRRP